MKFIRRFAVVVLTVAIIVAGAVLWSHASGGSSAGPRVPPPHEVEKLAQIRTGEPGSRPDTGLHLSDTSDLIRTSMIEAALAAFTITISAIRRQQRRMRHTP